MLPKKAVSTLSMVYNVHISLCPTDTYKGTAAKCYGFLNSYKWQCAELDASVHTCNPWRQENQEISQPELHSDLQALVHEGVLVLKQTFLYVQDHLVPLSTIAQETLRVGFPLRFSDDQFLQEQESLWLLWAVPCTSLSNCPPAQSTIHKCFSREQKQAASF